MRFVKKKFVIVFKTEFAVICCNLPQFAFTFCLRNLPLRFAFAICLCDLPLQFAFAICLCNLPL